MACCDVLRTCGSPTHPRRVRCRRDRPGQLRVDPFVSLYVVLPCGSADITRSLVEHGADTTARANDGRTALHVVTEVGSMMEVAPILVEHLVWYYFIYLFWITSATPRRPRNPHHFGSGPVLLEVENVRLVRLRF